MNPITLHKRILLICITGIALTIIWAIAAPYISNYVIDEILAISSLSICFLICTFLVSYTLSRPEKLRFRKLSRISVYLYPVLCILLIIGFINIDLSIFSYLVLMVVLFLAVFPLMHFFVFSEPTSLKSTIVLIVFFSVGVLMKRYHLPLAGTVLTLSLTFGAISFYIFGIRCLFFPDKAPYLKNIAFFSSITVVFSFLGLLFKLQHWPLGNFLVNSGQISLIGLTLIVLFTLPSSGYADWKTYQKKILLRLLLPWILVFLLFTLRFLLPEINQIIWGANKEINHIPFHMSEYQVILKNGLK
jgi:hypothetical protein